MAGPAPSRYADSLGLADASLTMSPAHARLNELTARMGSVHDDFESEKKARSSVMELKCRAIDEKIMRNKRSEDERLKPLYILIERLGLDIGSERDQLQILDSKLNNEQHLLHYQHINYLKHDSDDHECNNNHQYNDSDNDYKHNCRRLYDHDLEYNSYRDRGNIHFGN